MWAEVVFVLLAGVPAGRGEYSAYHYYETDSEDDDDDDEGDFYDIYVDDVDTNPTLMTTVPVEAVTRVRRYEDPDELRTLDSDELRYVTRSYPGFGGDGAFSPPTESALDLGPGGTTLSTTMGMDVGKVNIHDLNEDNASKNMMSSTSLQGTYQGKGYVNSVVDDARDIADKSTFDESIVTRYSVLGINMTTPMSTPSELAYLSTKASSSTASSTTASTTTLSSASTGQTVASNETTEASNQATEASNQTTVASNQTTEAVSRTISQMTAGTTAPPIITSSHKIDINAIIALIANLTYDYDWNLTEQFNKSLIEHGVPTCPTESTPTTTSTTPSPYDFANTSVVGKCFVCGLQTLEIPRDAFCADAFAGDFLPLVPIDPRARGKIATYRKYCRYLDVHNYVENPSEPRSVYGRFTGGCGVRWTDLSGVYTQRTCRARFRPLMGKHFASKRMAKLELALVNVENGCIISPMATLLPLSRGVSLYARFHACVCTGSWCNAAAGPPPRRHSVTSAVLTARWMLPAALGLHLAATVSPVQY